MTVCLKLVNVYDTYDINKDKCVGCSKMSTLKRIFCIDKQVVADTFRLQKA